MKKIIGFTNYLISEDGEIVNKRTGRVLKQSCNHKGYRHVVLSEHGTSNTKSIHRMVYEHYKSKIPKGMTINHIDGNKSNNNISNLEELTLRDNILHAVKIGAIKSGSECKLSRAVDRIDVISGDIISSYGSIRIASKKTCVAGSSIVNVCKGNRITAGGYKWEYSLS